jgi:hypothetical protein
MKMRICSTLLLLTFHIFSFSQVTKSKLSIKVDSLIKLDMNKPCYCYQMGSNSRYHLDSGLIYTCYLKFKNEGNDSIGFWMMTCFKSMFFKTDPDTLQFCIEMCRSDYPRYYKIAPNDTFKFHLEILKKVDQNQNRCRIGFVLVSSTNSFNLDIDKKLEETVKEGSIIWSDYIALE